MKCGKCLKPIPPARGYCITPACHSKMLGENTPEVYKPRKSWQKSDPKRCPFCSGENNGKTKCYISACDRGPNGSTCGCHYLMAGMGNVGPEGREIQRQRRLSIARQVQSWGGPRIVA